MKPKKNAFLFSSLALAAACTAQAAQIDVTGVVTALVTPIAPVNATVSSGVRGVHAITTSQTWTSDNEYFLTDRVFVPKGLTLTIQPGTKIYSSTNDNGTPTNRADDKVGSLIAARGGRIVANGTAAAPIVFSAVAAWETQQTIPADSIFDPDGVIGVAGNAPTTSDAGLWGGVVLLGNAYVLHLDGLTGNNLGRAQIEGFLPGGTPDDNTNGFPDASEYGFESSGEFARDDNDDSGIIRYVSIRHGGYEFETGREINGLTLGGVGANTFIENVEVVANQDDGIEFFGGTVSTSNILLAFNQDDSFDFDSGYTGTMQFFCAIQNPGFADGGFEQDGIVGTDEGQTAMNNAFSSRNEVTGVFVTNAGVTLSKPRMFNGTIIGPGRSNVPTPIAVGSGDVLTEKGNHGFIFDDYYNGEIYNSVIDDFSMKLAFFRDGATSYGTTADAQHNTLGRFGSGLQTQLETATVGGAAAPAPAVTTSGNLVVTVTAAAVAGSPLATNVPVTAGDTREIVAGKISAELNAVAAITEDYDVGFTGRTVILGSKVPGLLGQDNSLNIGIAVGTQVGVPLAASSANTAVGGSSQVSIGQPLTYISGTNVRGLLMDTAGFPTGNNSAVNTDPKLRIYTRDGNNFLTAIDPRPAADSPLLQVNGATVQAGAPSPVTYRGAFSSGVNWASGWTQTWQSGVLQGNAVVDVDGDGIDDVLEGTTALTSLGFSATVNNVTNHGGVPGTNRFESIYDTDSILDLRTVGQTMVEASGANVTLTLPLQKSPTLNNWVPVPQGPFTLTIPKEGDKQFYRLSVEGAN